MLTWVDERGYPFSIRCRPERSDGSWIISLKSSLAIRPGPAGLLWHSHNNYLWKLRMSFFRGTLRERGDELIFTPQKFVAGVAGTRKLHMLRAFIESRRMTRRYLAHRNLDRPSIPWKRIKELKKQVPRA